MEVPEGANEEDPSQSESEIFSQPPPILAKQKQDGELGIFDHHHIFWIGDLNYRVDLPRTEITRLINEQDWQGLLVADQLIQQIKRNKAFKGFEEGNISFLPTYKFDSGTDNYDTSPKMRLPAYCDRILWRKDSKIQSITYQNHMEYKVSDHKPVSAVVSVKLYPVSPRQLKRELSQKSVLGISSKSYLFTTLRRTVRYYLRYWTTYIVLGAVVSALVYYIIR